MKKIKYEEQPHIIELRRKCRAINQAIDNGKQIFLDTSFGKLNVFGVHPDTLWVTTRNGNDKWNQRSWACHNGDIETLYDQIEGI